MIGGISRGIVEGPFEYIKVRRQVEQPWKLSEVMSGSGATIFRNSLLFSAFVINVDISKQIVPGGLSPFLTGKILLFFTISYSLFITYHIFYSSSFIIFFYFIIFTCCLLCFTYYIFYSWLFITYILFFIPSSIFYNSFFCSCFVNFFLSFSFYLFRPSTF